MYPHDVFRHGPRTKKRVAITFDDGPDGEWTPQVLAVLSRYGVKATFFCVGMMVHAFPDVTRRLVAEGHVIGNHTWDHPQLPRLHPAQVQEELYHTEQEIQRVAGVRPRLFRPPYGELSRQVMRQVIALRDKVILWSVDSLCWTGLDSEHIAAIVLAHLQPGAIVLMHSAGGVRKPTVEALPRIIEVTHASGYTFTTVSDLLGVPPYKSR
ncbi:MAG: polysaccharide deacetylase family protein [Alicyclobacillus macrosporangiidus]|uniref:polysaccharide deacetylase family protein n=1 Tax=Alicyclobacillus macrosporangiidus TaxID=392015 RepID=UPI0026F3101E|nr:polysaccharide deacetylase family protein [Alicyclobacillus macrosporangiidus]MCL6600227.1 polysaccharide deacetylase family protein [Alicyclobacillus macrosporangiidus]